MKNPKLKLKDFYNSLNKPLKEQEEKSKPHIPDAASQVANRKIDKTTTSNDFDVKIEIPGIEGETDVNIKLGHATGPFEDVTISWGDESYNVMFDEEEMVEDHENEGQDWIFLATDKESKTEFRVDVAVEADYDKSGNIQEVDWDSLEVTYDDEGEPLDEKKKSPASRYMSVKDRIKKALGISEEESLDESSERKRQREGTCGYGVDGELGDEPAGSDLLELDKPDCPERFWCSKDSDCDGHDDDSCGNHECHGGCCTAMCSPDPGSKGDHGSSTKPKKSKLSEALITRLKIRAGIIK